ncbi:MAG: tocopherol cyclase family protein [Acidobacteriota bacterium]
MSEQDNQRHWDAAKQGVYEVWYVTWNDPGTDQGFWLRYITEAPLHDGTARGELWFARFDPRAPDRTFGIHKRFSQVDAACEPFALAIGGARLGHDHAIGAVAGGGHQVEWNLRWDPSSYVLRQLPDVMYARGGLGETTVLSPNPRVPLSGSLVVDGERLAFDRAIAGQTHLWGKKHAYSWVWGRCAEFAGAPDGVLELLGTRLERRGRVLPPMALVVLDLDGERHHLNQLRHVAAHRAKWGAGRVTFSAWSPTVKIEGEMTAPPEAFVMAPYEDPDGTHVYCANTEIGDARVTVYRRSGLGWREHRRLEARHRAHFELGGRTRDPAVVREHVLVG